MTYFRVAYFFRLVGIFFFVLLATLSETAAAKVVINISVIRVDRPKALPLSRLDIPAKDWGFAGAKLAIDDNQTTGHFLDMFFEVATEAVTPDTLIARMDDHYKQGVRLFVVLANAEELITAADHYDDALILNALATENHLRDKNCRANLLHITPSNAMKTDALVQYLLWKKWKKWFLVFGSHEKDHQLAQNYRNSATKFGANIVEEREFVDTQGARRTDTGHVLVQKQIPVFTQSTEEYDVLVVADESAVFAGYLPYRTWEARPVVGSAGLKPLTWNAAHEAWGATQFQRRFERTSQRLAREEDYQSWLALRAIGEAATRTLSNDATKIRSFLLGKEFGVAAFKGVKLNFRAWNGQLRQPILLSNLHLNVSVSPQEGYLHQFSALDSLGLDAVNSQCQAFTQ